MGMYRLSNSTSSRIGAALMAAIPATATFMIWPGSGERENQPVFTERHSGDGLFCAGHISQVRGQFEFNTVPQANANLVASYCFSMILDTRPPRRS
jgi:hypothetical protein